MVLRITSVIALFVLGFFVPNATTLAAPAANDHTVLILASSVVGSPSLEQMAIPPGFDVELATDASWAAKSEADFASYRAIIIGDPACSDDVTRISAAEANANTWADAVDDKLLIIGSDPTFHAPYQAGALQMVNNAVRYVVEGTLPGKTSALVVLSCYYNNKVGSVPVPVLDGFGTFMVKSNPNHDETHIVDPTHPAMFDLTDGFNTPKTISYWQYPMHALFTTFPENFDVLAQAKGEPGGTYVNEVDGQIGTPYILVRSAGGIVEEPCEEMPTISLGADGEMFDPDTLWMPNKKMVDITVLNPVVTGEGVTVTREITCSETPKIPWTVFYEDGVDIWHFKLRADRNGAASPETHSPRIYTITYTATDACGNVATATGQVIVSHDQKSKKK